MAVVSALDDVEEHVALGRERRGGRHVSAGVAATEALLSDVLTVHGRRARDVGASDAGELRAVVLDSDARRVAVGTRAVGGYVEVTVAVPDQVVGVADTGCIDLERCARNVRIVRAALRRLDVDGRATVGGGGDLRVRRVEDQGGSGEQLLTALPP